MPQPESNDRLDSPPDVPAGTRPIPSDEAADVEAAAQQTYVKRHAWVTALQYQGAEKSKHRVREWVAVPIDERGSRHERDVELLIEISPGEWVGVHTGDYIVLSLGTWRVYTKAAFEAEYEPDSQF